MAYLVMKHEKTKRLVARRRTPVRQKKENISEKKSRSNQKTSCVRYCGSICLILFAALGFADAMLVLSNIQGTLDFFNDDITVSSGDKMQTKPEESSSNNAVSKQKSTTNIEPVAVISNTNTEPVDAVSNTNTEPVAVISNTNTDPVSLMTIPGSSDVHLQCEEFGGPSSNKDTMMKYWFDIKQDAEYRNPIQDHDNRYLAFQVDDAGDTNDDWEDNHLAMESALALAFATGRTLVLPPPFEMGSPGATHAEKRVSFDGIYDLKKVNDLYDGIRIITMDEFLRKEGLTGKLADLSSGSKVDVPYNGITDWSTMHKKSLWEFLDQVGEKPMWSPDECMVLIPQEKKDTKSFLANMTKLQVLLNDLTSGSNGHVPEPADYVGKSPQINAPPRDRVGEFLAGRKDMCTYDERIHNAKLLYFKTDVGSSPRSLLSFPFYTFIFFEDYKDDMWLKRLIRDRIRYKDELMCAAARVIDAVQERAQGDSKVQSFDSFNTRRGSGYTDQGKSISFEEFIKQTDNKILEGRTVYIGANKQNKSFFDPLKKKFDLTFLEDYVHLLPGIDQFYYPLVDQLVEAKGMDHFPMFVSYVDRIRGYDSFDKSSKQRMEYYYGTTEKQYYPLSQPLSTQEFPSGWRHINFSLK